MYARRGAGLGFVLILLILVAAVVGMQLGWLVFMGNGDPGTPPKIQLRQYEEFVHVSRIRIAGDEYGLWDVRDNRTNILYFMLLVKPGDGTRIRDPDLQSRAFSLRLALQTAHVVKSINDGAKTAEDTTARIANLGTLAISVAEISGQRSIARDLRRFGTLIGEKTETALALAASVQGSAEYAEHLIKDPSEQNADLFMTSLGVSAMLTLSQRAALVYLLISNALQAMAISPGPWLEMLYNQLTQGTNPTIGLLGGTFGAYETSNTTKALAARGVY